MFFGGDDDDGDFLSATGGSKLASLFARDPVPTEETGNNSFKYTGEAQPKMKAKVTADPQQTSVLHHCVVHAFRYVDSKSTSVGKLGAAILGSHTKQQYQLLLYVSKQQQVSKTTLSTNFTFTIQGSNYVSFYDDQRQLYSVLFDSQTTLCDFCIQVAIAKANSAGVNLSDVIIQDVLHGEGQALVYGDLAELVYQGWLLADHKQSTMFDKNITGLKLKLGKGKVLQGWEEGVVGMKRGSQRVLVIPPSKAYGNRTIPNRVPANSTLIFHITVNKVKFTVKESVDDSESSTSSPIPIPVTETGTPLPTTPDSVKSRSVSINETLQGAHTSERASIINRMARMGTSILPVSDDQLKHTDPKSPSKTSDDADTDYTEDANMKSRSVSDVRTPTPDPTHIREKPAIISPKPTRPLTSAPTYYPSLPPQQVPVPLYNQTGFHQMQGVPGFYQQPHGPAFYAASSTDMQPLLRQPVMSSACVTTPVTGSTVDSVLLMMETRQFQTDTRMTLSKISDKMDHLTSQVGNIPTPSAHTQSPFPIQGAITMETSTILSNINRIVEDNDRLKSDVIGKNNKIESQNDKISQLLSQNQRFLEESNTFLERRNETYHSTTTASQQRVLTLEQDKALLTEDIALATSKLTNTQYDLTNSRQHENELISKLSHVQARTDTLTSELQQHIATQQETEMKIQTFSSSLREERTHNNKLKSSIEQLQDNIKIFQEEKSRIDNLLEECKHELHLNKETHKSEIVRLRSSHDEEIQKLLNQMNQQKIQAGTVTAEQMSDIEGSVEQRCKERYDRLFSEKINKHEETVSILTTDKQSISDLLAVSKKEITTMLQTQDESNNKTEALIRELEGFHDINEQFQRFRDQAQHMKQRMQARIAELLEKEHRESENSTRVSDDTRPDAVIDKVKTVMNGVFHSLREQVDFEEMYNGSQLLSLVMATIKDVTLKLTSEEDGDTSDNDGGTNSEPADEEEHGPDLPAVSSDDGYIDTNEPPRPSNIEPVTDVDQSDGNVVKPGGDDSQSGIDVSQSDGDVNQSDGGVNESGIDVSQSGVDVSQSDGGVNESGGDVSQSGVDVSQSDGDVSQSRVDVNQSDGGVNESGGDVSQSGADVGKSESGVVESESSVCENVVDESRLDQSCNAVEELGHDTDESECHQSGRLIECSTQEDVSADLSEQKNKIISENDNYQSVFGTEQTSGQDVLRETFGEEFLPKSDTEVEDNFEVLPKPQIPTPLFAGDSDDDSDDMDWLTLS